MIAGLKGLKLPKDPRSSVTRTAEAAPHENAKSVSHDKCENEVPNRTKSGLNTQIRPNEVQ
ncbi:hypothetical protein ABLN85_02330, partial [Mycobacterium tuberculosis]